MVDSFVNKTWMSVKKIFSKGYCTVLYTLLFLRAVGFLPVVLDDHCSPFLQCGS